MTRYSEQKCAFLKKYISRALAPDYRYLVTVIPLILLSLSYKFQRLIVQISRRRLHAKLRLMAAK